MKKTIFIVSWMVIALLASVVSQGWAQDFFCKNNAKYYNPGNIGESGPVLALTGNNSQNVCYGALIGSDLNCDTIAETNLIYPRVIGWYDEGEPDPQYPTYQDFTIEFWIKGEDVDPIASTERVILSRAQPDYTKSFWWVSVYFKNGVDELRFNYATSTGFAYKSASVTVLADKWYHVAVGGWEQQSFTPGFGLMPYTFISIYFDALQTNIKRVRLAETLAARGLYYAPDSGTGYFSFGIKNSVSPKPWKGALDMVRISETDIYNMKGGSDSVKPSCPLTVVTNATEGLWHFNDPDITDPNGNPIETHAYTDSTGTYNLAGAGTDYNAVELVSFRGSITEKGILLKWETASEMDHIGFNVFRKEIDNTAPDAYVRINPSLIPAQGNLDTGANYEFLDETTLKNTGYAYMLEMVDTFGRTSYSPTTEVTPDSTTPPPCGMTAELVAAGSSGSFMAVVGLFGIFIALFTSKKFAATRTKEK